MFSKWEHWKTSSTNWTQSALSQASPSCPQALSALNLQLLFNPQSFCLSSTFTVCAPYLLHPLYQYLPLSIPLQTCIPFLLRGHLDSVTHQGASVCGSLVLLNSSHTLCPSGLVLIELAPVRDDGRKKQNINKSDQEK